MKIQGHFRSSLLLGLVVLAIGVGCWLLWLRPSEERPREITREGRAVPILSRDELLSFVGFSQWLEVFSQASPGQRATLAAAGLELARARRRVMEELMRSDPQQALAHAVTLDVWQNLPPELQAEVEEPFSAIADFRVLPVCLTGSPDAAQVAARLAAGEKIPEITRVTEIKGLPELDSYVFGRRNSLTTKENSPVQGIHLGGRAALREGVFHPLAAREIATAESLYPLADPLSGGDFGSGQPLTKEPLTALAGGRIFKFADRASFDFFSAQITALDEKPGPHSGAAVLFLPLPADGGEGFNLDAAAALSDSLASAWTETKKKVFMIRCDFSDKTNASFPVVSAGTYGTLLNTTVSNHIRDFSYGKTWIEATVSATVTRLPQPTTYYDDDIGGGSTRNATLLSNAKSAYQTANPSFVASSYDIIGVFFVNIGMKGSGVLYAGLAGGSDLWIQGSSDAGVHVHEFGHNYGVGHSSFWTPPLGSANPVDAAGTSSEYGDSFDVMGDGTLPEGVFHAEAKQRLNWLAAGEWTDTSAGGSGIYRVHRIDHPNTSGTRGLRVTKAAGEYYWLSYRRQFPNSWLKAGANIVWQRAGQGHSWLIDTTPGTLVGTSDRTDGSIAIGRTYSDGNSHITPLARGGISPSEYLDIRINTGPFPGNVAPGVTLSGPSTIAARRTCIFTAQAADGNGDALAYSWDFGQGFTFDNHPSVAFAWSSGGNYTVKVTVSDMKGGTTQAIKAITVNDPVTTWTARANAAAGDFNTLVASPSKVIAAGEDYSSFRGPVTTSADGITWTATQLDLYGQALAGVWDGTRFLLAGMDYTFTAPAGWLGCIFTSPTANAGTWTRRVYAGPPLRGIAYGGGVYVAVGDSGTIRRSTDSITWPLVTSGTTHTLASITYGGGKFIVVGYGATNGDTIVLTSTDGNSWTNTSAGSGVLDWQDLRHINWAGDRLIASGWYGKIRQSTDLGVTFSSTRTSTEETPAAPYGNGVWFAAGLDRDHADADIDLVSTDGSNWTALATPSLEDRNAAVFFNNTFITAGDNHSLRQSATISPAAIGYYSWRDQYFPDHGALSTHDGDSDGDGNINLLEYSLGRSPVSGAGDDGSAALPQAVIHSTEPGLSDRLALQLHLPEPTVGDLVYIVEASSTLDGSWTPLATKVGTGSWTWNPGGTSRIVLGTPAAGRMPLKIGDSQAIGVNPRRFLRLRTYINP